MNIILLRKKLAVIRKLFQLYNTVSVINFKKRIKKKKSECINISDIYEHVINFTKYPLVRRQMKIALYKKKWKILDWAKTFYVKRVNVFVICIKNEHVGFVTHVLGKYFYFHEFEITLPSCIWMTMEFCCLFSNPNSTFCHILKVSFMRKWKKLCVCAIELKIA